MRKKFVMVVARQMGVAPCVVGTCGHIYAPGTEQCDWCEYESECCELAKKL